MALILAIDDDTNMLKLLSKQIEAMGHTVIVAENGKEGISLAESGNPDLVLLDIMMPEMDGFGVLKRIKFSDMTKNTPVIMLTSKSGRESVAEAMRYGVVDYMVKPYNYFNLSKKIEVGLEHGNRIKNYYKGETPPIMISRDHGVTLVSIMNEIRDPQLISQAKEQMNAGFLTRIKNDEKVLDLRGVEEISANDIRIIDILVGLLGTEHLHIVTGRHYGTLVAHSDLEDRVQLFISLGDFEIYLNRSDES